MPIEDKVTEALAAGSITTADADAVRDFAALLRKAGPTDGTATAAQRAFTRWHLPLCVADGFTTRA
jgi:hypothetical protein